MMSIGDLRLFEHYAQGNGTTTAPLIRGPEGGKKGECLTSSELQSLGISSNLMNVYSRWACMEAMEDATFKLCRIEASMTHASSDLQWTLIARVHHSINKL